jgi:hypothetical protein
MMMFVSRNWRSIRDVSLVAAFLGNVLDVLFGGDSGHLLVGQRLLEGWNSAVDGVEPSSRWDHGELTIFEAD